MVYSEMCENVDEDTQLQSIYNYIMSLSGRVATPQLLQEILERRQDFITYLQQQGLYYILSADIKNSLMWEVTEKIQTILKLFDDRIYEFRRLDFDTSNIDDLQESMLRKKLEYAKLY